MNSPQVIEGNPLVSGGLEKIHARAKWSGVAVINCAFAIRPAAAQEIAAPVPVV
jgi:hypothetical protein